MLYKTVIPQNLIKRSMGYKPKQTLTWTSVTMYHVDIRKILSPLQPVWSVLSVSSVDMDQTWMSNMNFLCELTIAIPWLACLLRMATAVSLRFELVNSLTSDSFNLFYAAMWAVPRRLFLIELFAWSDGWQRNRWQTIHMILWVPVSSITQCK